MKRRWLIPHSLPYLCVVFLSVSKEIVLPIKYPKLVTTATIPS